MKQNISEGVRSCGWAFSRTIDSIIDIYGGDDDDDDGDGDDDGGDHGDGGHDDYIKGPISNTRFVTPEVPVERFYDVINRLSLSKHADMVNQNAHMVGT
jgi:hypothetical protein